jgi:hypothetical protein
MGRVSVSAAVNSTGRPAVGTVGEAVAGATTGLVAVIVGGAWCWQATLPSAKASIVVNCFTTVNLLFTVIARFSPPLVVFHNRIPAVAGQRGIYFFHALAQAELMKRIRHYHAVEIGPGYGLPLAGTVILPSALKYLPAAFCGVALTQPDTRKASLRSLIAGIYLKVEYGAPPTMARSLAKAILAQHKAGKRRVDPVAIGLFQPRRIGQRGQSTHGDSAREGRYSFLIPVAALEMVYVGPLSVAPHAVEMKRHTVVIRPVKALHRTIAGGSPGWRQVYLPQ